MTVTVGTWTELDAFDDEMVFSFPASPGERILLVFTSGQEPISVTTDGGSNTFIKVHEWSSVWGEGCFAYLSPELSGSTSQIVVTFSSNALFLGAATRLTGVHPTTPAGDTGSSSVHSDAPEVELTTTVAGEALFAFLHMDGSRTVTPYAGYTSFDFNNFSGAIIYTDDAGSAGSKTIGASLNIGVQHTIGAFALLPAEPLVGNTDTSEFTSGFSIDGVSGARWNGMEYVAAESGVAKRLYLYANDRGENESIKLLIADASGTVLASTDPIPITTGSGARWVSGRIPDTPITKGQTYYIGVYSSGGDGRFGVMYSGLGTYSDDTSGTYDALPDELSDLYFNADNVNMALYAAGEAGGGSVLVPVGLASEVDEALELSVQRAVHAGLALENDAALSVDAARYVAVGLAAESDASLSATSRKARSVQIAAESDLALALAASHAVPVGVATESDASLTASVRKRINVGLVAESSIVLPTGAHKRRPIGIASEDDAALGMRAHRLYGVGIGTESDSALGATWRRVRAVRLVTEFDQAFRLMQAAVAERAERARRLLMGYLNGR